MKMLTPRIKVSQSASMARDRSRRRRARAVREPQPRLRTDHTILQLRHVHSAAMVAVAALRQQNCELDGDIASVLQRCVCDRLQDQLEKLEAAGGAVPRALRGGSGPRPKAPARTAARLRGL